MIQIDDILIDLCGNDFLEPYLRRELERRVEAPEREGEERKPKPLPNPRVAIVIRSDSGNVSGREFGALCCDFNLPVLSLYCPLIVGTGMAGLPRRMAAGIYKGSYFNIKGNVSRVSVIHASDMARAAAMAAGTDGAFTVTDGTHPTVDALADALAYRLGDKRLFTIKPWMARLWYGKEYYGQLTSDHLSDDSFALSFPDFKPTPVTQYLRSHVYDENSL